VILLDVVDGLLQLDDFLSQTLLYLPVLRAQLLLLDLKQLQFGLHLFLGQLRGLYLLGPVFDRFLPLHLRWLAFLHS